MKLLLLDSNSLINRAFYALPTLQDRSGRYTGALFGFVSMLSKLIKSEHPTHIAAAFDVHQPTFRHLKYDGYKAKRHPMPEELKAQVPAMKELLLAMGVTVVEAPGYEADDIIGTLAAKSDMPTVIVSGDKDVLQLVSDKTTVLHTKRGITDVIRYTPEALLEEGLTPQGVVEMKSLMGDHSDNIPGVPGVGEKTALEFVQRYGTIENLYEHIDEVKGKMREKLLDGRQSAEFSHWLATIVTDAPVETGDFSKYRFSETIPYRAKKLMEGRKKILHLLERHIYQIGDFFANKRIRLLKPVDKELFPFFHRTSCCCNLLEVLFLASNFTLKIDNFDSPFGNIVSNHFPCITMNDNTIWRV